MTDIHQDITPPKYLGFHMPAEWERHERTWMMWPSRSSFWPDMTATKSDYAAVAHAIRAYEPVSMAVRPEDKNEALAMLGSDIEIVVAALDDSWARDAGPCFLSNGNGGRAGCTFRFNAWGRKYAPYNNDDAFAGFVLSHTGLHEFASNLVAEGGGLSVDGEGTILTTESCFPNPNRNPGWSRTQIERELRVMLGADKVIWLPGNIHETETDGHVDGIAVFAAPGVVIVEAADDPDDPWRQVKRANIEALGNQTDAKGRSLRIVTIPEADNAPADCERFCRSYTNSYIVNDAVIMPKYGIRNDAVVAEIFQSVFPGRDIVQVPIMNIAVGGGGIHCITQQEPMA